MASSAGISPQNSARDKTKPLPNLGEPASHKSTYHLVVCGAGNAVKDIWLFGEFLGFIDALKKSNPPIKGDFVNCYPVGEYFNTNGLKDIPLVIKACSSGAFAKAFRIVGQCNFYLHTSSKDEVKKSYSDRRSISGRLRNSLFGAAFVETLGPMKDEDEIWTLEKQKQKMEAGVSGQRVHPDLISHSQVVSDSCAKRLMWDILSRDYIDVSFDRASASARRVLTPSGDASTSLPSTSQHPMQSYAAAEVILSDEMGLIDTNYSEPADVGVTEMYFQFHKFLKGKKLDVLRDLIAVLRYRFNLQERVFIVAESLMALGLLNYEAIVLPMGLHQPNEFGICGYGWAYVL